MKPHEGKNAGILALEDFVCQAIPTATTSQTAKPAKGISYGVLVLEETVLNLRSDQTRNGETGESMEPGPPTDRDQPAANEDITPS